MFSNYIDFSSILIFILIIFIILFRVKIYNRYLIALSTINFITTIVALIIWIGLKNNIPLLETRNQLTILYLIRGIGTLSIFLYIKALVNIENYFKAENLWYFLPIPVLFIAHICTRGPGSMVPDFMESVGMKLFVSDWKSFYSPQGVIYVLFQFYIFTYLFLSWRLFILHLKNRLNTDHQSLMIKWGLAFLIFKSLGLTLIFLKRLSWQFNYQHLDKITTISISIFALASATYTFYHPELILNLSRVNTYKKKKATIILNEDVVELVDQINLMMQQEKFYLNPVFNISNFAAHNQISIAKMKLIILENGFSNFSSYMNSYRIKHAENLIKENYLDIYAIETLAKESGFNSIVNFYKEFKKKNLCTPKEFWEKNKLA